MEDQDLFHMRLREIIGKTGGVTTPEKAVDCALFVLATAMHVVGAVTLFGGGTEGRAAARPATI